MTMSSSPSSAERVDTLLAPLIEGEGGATNGHYDQDPRVFGLFLDPTLKYSSGIYASGG